MRAQRAPSPPRGQRRVHFSFVYPSRELVVSVYSDPRPTDYFVPRHPRSAIRSASALRACAATEFSQAQRGYAVSPARAPMCFVMPSTFPKARCARMPSTFLKARCPLRVRCHRIQISPKSRCARDAVDCFLKRV